MINTEQLIVLMPLFDVNMPANAQAFFNQLNKIASFDLIDIEPFIVWALNVNDTGPFNTHFDECGFGSLYFINNMGSMLIGFAIYIVGVIALALLDCCNTKFERAAKMSEYLRRNLFHNYLIGMMNESYSLLSVCTLISFYHISFASYGDTIQTVTSMFFFAMLFIYPIAVYRILVRGWNGNKWNINFHYLKDMFSHFFEELRTDIGPLALIHPFWFLIRRFLMGVVVVVLRKHLCFQVFLKGMSIVATVIISGYVPFATKTKRNIEFFNETIIMIVMYCFFCFSDFVPDPQARSSIGFVCCSIVSLHLLVNLFLMGKEIFLEILKDYRFYCAKKRLRKQRPVEKVKY